MMDSRMCDAVYCTWDALALMRHVRFLCPAVWSTHVRLRTIVLRTFGIYSKTLRLVVLHYALSSCSSKRSLIVGATRKRTCSLIDCSKPIVSSAAIPAARFRVLFSGHYKLHPLSAPLFKKENKRFCENSDFRENRNIFFQLRPNLIFISKNYL